MVADLLSPSELGYNAQSAQTQHTKAHTTLHNRQIEVCCILHCRTASVICLPLVSQLIRSEQWDNGNQHRWYCLAACTLLSGVVSQPVSSCCLWRRLMQVVYSLSALYQICTAVSVGIPSHNSGPGDNLSRKHQAAWLQQDSSGPGICA